MKTLTVHGWNIGFKKVEFTNMLQRELGYTLTLAKSATDNILAKEEIELTIEDSEYERLSRLATELGAIVLV